MPKSKHTPGPWEYLPPDQQHPSRVAVAAMPQANNSGYGVTIYDAPLTNETRANAKLIAAAPTLEKRLILTMRHASLLARMILRDIPRVKAEARSVVQQLVDGVKELEDAGVKDALTHTWTDKAQAAISKASQ